MQCEVRAYRPEDLDACRTLWVELTAWHREIYGDPAIGGAHPERQFDEHLERVGPTNLWVAESDDTVIGLTGLIWDDNACEVEPVVVATDHRRRGVGKRLVHAVVDEARARGARQLSVRPVARNDAALAFFRDMGFGIVGHVELFMDFRPDRAWEAMTSSTLHTLRC